MNTLPHTYAPLTISAPRVNIYHRFMAWCTRQEENRIAWMAIAVGGHGCVITPITLLLIMLAGNSFLLWPLAMASMTMVLVPNLAALSTKVTIPVFALSVVIDVAICANCLAILLA